MQPGHATDLQNKAQTKRACLGSEHAVLQQRQGVQESSLLFVIALVAEPDGQRKAAHIPAAHDCECSRSLHAPAASVMQQGTTQKVERMENCGSVIIASVTRLDNMVET